MSTMTITAGAFVAHLKRTMDSSHIMDHSFLRAFEDQYLSPTQLQTFAIAWYRTARAHKEAFPALVYTTRDDDVRFELIEILRDEYGNGDRTRIHGRLLLRFLRHLGISDAQIETFPVPNGIKHFADTVLRVWREENPVYAFGFHFSLEYLAASLHAHFARGLRKYSALPAETLEYFNYHEVAEQQHADYSEVGLETYSADPQNHAELEKGVRAGIDLLRSLWETFDQLVFSTAPPRALHESTA